MKLTKPINKPSSPVAPNSEKHLVKYQYIYIPVLIGVIFIVFSNIGKGFIPDYLGLSNVTNPEKIAEVIISVISSVLGISLALIILGLEIFRDRLGRTGANRLLTNSRVVFILTLQVSVLMYSFLFLIICGNNIDNAELTILYFLATIFAMSILSMFLLGRGLLGEADSKEYILKECEKITPQSIVDVLGYNNGILNFEKELENIDSSPFLVLRELGEKHAMAKSPHMSAYIINLTTVKVLTLITNTTERRLLSEIYKALFMSWSGIINESIKNNSVIALNQVWKSFSLIHNHYSKNSIELNKAEPLEDFIKGYIEKLLQNGQDDSVIEGLFVIENIYTLHLQFMLPKENELENLNYIFDLKQDITYNPYLENQWNIIADHFPRLIELISKKSIEYNRERVVSSSFMYYQTLIATTKRAPIGEYQKHYIIVQSYLNLNALILDAYDKGVINNYSADWAIEYSTFKSVISDKPKYFETLFCYLCQLYKDLNNRKNFTMSINFGNALFGAFRTLSRLHEKNDEVTETVNSVMRFISYLKMKYEKDILNNSRNYLALSELLKSMKEYHLDSAIHDGTDKLKKPDEKISTDYINQIDKLLASFEKEKVANKNIKKEESWW